MSDTDIHSCGYYCDRHACIVVQRNELRDKLFEKNLTSEKSIQTSDSKEAESARAWVGLTDEEMKEIWDERGWYVTLFQKIEAKLRGKNA
jgi:hypothetical protein